MDSETRWPKIGWESRQWVPRVSPDLISASVRKRHSGPYKAAVVPRISDQRVDISIEVLTLADEAAAEIARFDAELGAEITPFAAILLRSESASSSMIENLTSGAKAIALAELGSTDKRNATEIVGNVCAMQAALTLADHLDSKAILEMHRSLMERTDPDTAGKWRTEQVWIGGTTFGPHDAAFVAPHHEHIPALVSDLVDFMQRTDIPVLVHAAIAHAQFETIHPFTDGNGRTGRALLHSILRGRGLTRSVTVPVSAGLLTNTSSYFSALTGYRDGDPATIIEKLAEAAFSATANGRVLVSDLRAIRSTWNTKIKARQGASAWRLADVLLRRPVIDAAVVAQELGIAVQNALRVIGALADAGVLTEFTGYKRNRMWQAREVLNALDDFAERAGRRA